ncbi:hypothetical protein [Streptomyces sp. PT12]|uniref:hypothetical protein n=1 Tax=Streptomyces sp. PT12 TaxID=1510197 RepID=UPI000DE216E1|nr:hypothetical protein [Streptomyces sp. PT12]RBM24347.1 hypothetical protein DEH69_00305 [Streptomyces sp. PT12]
MPPPRRRPLDAAAAPAPAHQPGPLGRFSAPAYTSGLFCAVALGNARGAVEEFEERARTARRPPTAPDRLPRLRAKAPLITVWGATALLRHVLTIEPPAPDPARTVRNTSVWRRLGERWLLVHNHEDVIATP